MVSTVLYAVIREDTDNATYSSQGFLGVFDNLALAKDCAEKSLKGSFALQLKNPVEAKQMTFVWEALDFFAYIRGVRQDYHNVSLKIVQLNQAH